MITKRVFPMRAICQSAKVVLYGAGNNARDLYKQNEILCWCDIFAAVDRNYKNIADFPIEVYDIKKLQDIDFDQILVSVVDPYIRTEIRDILLSMDIDAKKIITDIDVFYRCEDNDDILVRKAYNSESTKLRIGFWPGGVMGDNIISLRLYQEIVRLAPNCEIDVFTTFDNFPEHIFYAQKNLRKILHMHPCEADKDTYDLMIQSHFEPSLLYCNLARLEKENLDLVQRIKILYRYQTTDWFFCMPGEYMCRIQWDRSEFLGYTCYTLLGSSGAFDIKDSNIFFPLNPDYEEEYRNIGLSDRYITFSYGASDPQHTGKQNVKVWPKTSYIELIQMIKNNFSDVEIVQVDGKGMPTVPGANRYVMGRNLEVVKHILKHSMCHIDNEGGLVHMATQLGTKCFVMFGPTPISFFGYENNTNFKSKICGECCGLVPDWYTRCYKYSDARCMSSITATEVFSAVSEYLRGDGL